MGCFGTKSKQVPAFYQKTRWKNGILWHNRCKGFSGKGFEGVKFVVVRFEVEGKTAETAEGNQREQPAKGAESIIIKFYCG